MRLKKTCGTGEQRFLHSKAVTKIATGRGQSPVRACDAEVEALGGRTPTKANGIWMSQVARNLCDDGDGFLTGKRYLIHDRDPLFTTEFLGTLAASGVKPVKLPPRSPNLNPHAERFVRTIKESCLERMILFGEDSLRKTIGEFVAH